MSDRLKALREKRGVAIQSMRGVIEAAEQRPADKRDLTAEELAKHEALFKEADGYRAQIEAEERTAELERTAATREIEQAERGKKGETTPAQMEMRAFGKALLYGYNSLSAEDKRAYQAGSDTEGGYLRPPQQFVQELLKNVDNIVFMRGRATKYTVVQPESLGVPTLDTDLADADWTTELQTGSEDTTMRFGKRELRPHPVAKLIKMSKKLLRASALPVEQIVMDRMTYKFGVTQEKGFLTGTGMQQPLGVFTASADGIPTTQDVSTGNSTTAITFDGLIEAKYSLKGQYWNKADWLFHRDALKQIAKLKDGEGQYIWRMSVRDGEPDTLLGRPLMMSEYAPNTFTTGLYVGMFGDFSYYWIVDALDMTVQRLVELYAANNQDGFIGRMETDGAPVLAEAFARVKLA